MSLLHRLVPGSFALLLAATLGSPLSGQDPPQPPCVFVCTENWLPQVERLAGPAAVVRCLAHADLAPGALDHVRLLDGPSDCPRVQLWRDRLAAQGALRASVCAARSPAGRSLTELERLHAALVELLPEHRELFDSNLARELSRHRHPAPAEQLVRRP